MRTSIAGDFHIPYQDVELVDKWIEHVKEKKPERVIINGDLFDFERLSLKFKSIPGHGMSCDDELKLGKEFFETLRSFYDGDIVYLTGNHEFRLRSYYINKSEELYAGYEDHMERELEMERLDIQFLDVPSNYATFQDNYFELENEFLCGHFDMARTGLASTAVGLMQKFGMSIIQAHVHRISRVGRWQYRGTQHAVEGGCMCKVENNYRRNANWEQGWVDLVDGKPELYPVL